jgi:nitric oxide reductase subunit B
MLLPRPVEPRRELKPTALRRLSQMLVARRGFLISKTWIQAVILVVLAGFLVLGLLAYRTYMAHPPVPARVVGPAGNVLFTGADVTAGQKVFLNNG